MSSRRWVAAVVLLVLGLAPAVAQRIVNACVVDSNRVSQAFMRESSRARALDDFIESVEEEIARMTSDIDVLKSRRVEAVRDNDDDAVADLDEQLREREENLTTYRQLQERKYEEMIEDLVDNDAYYRELIAAIQQVCEEEGYSYALDVRIAGLLWWDPDIDVTDRVIEVMTLR